MTIVVGVNIYTHHMYMWIVEAAHVQMYPSATSAAFARAYY
jgi:hypothetical protein